MNDSITLDTLGGRLLAAAEEMLAIERGERAPSVERLYEGPVLVEVRENGKTTWRLADVRLDLDPDALDVHAIRDGLGQSQEGLAALLGVPLATVRNWDQGRRSPRGPASQLLRVAARHPGALLDLARRPGSARDATE